VAESDQTRRLYALPVAKVKLNRRSGVGAQGEHLRWCHPWLKPSAPKVRAPPEVLAGSQLVNCVGCWSKQEITWRKNGGFQPIAVTHHSTQPGHRCRFAQSRSFRYRCSAATRRRGTSPRHDDLGPVKDQNFMVPGPQRQRSYRTAAQQPCAQPPEQKTRA
jgi:hypothetical protein